MATDLLARGAAAQARNAHVPPLARLADLAGIVVPATTALVTAGTASYIADSKATAALALAHPTICKADATGRYFRLVTDAYAASVTQFGAVGDDATDCTAAIQAAIAALLAGVISALYIPRGTYRISSAISLPDNVITGLRIFGESKTASIIKQMTDDTAIFSFGEIDLMHSCEFASFSMTWANAQTGHDSATCFRFLPKAASNRSVFECNFHDLFAANCYTFMRGETALFWGNSVRDITCSTEGGFVNIAGTSGQPKVGFDNVYISGGAAGEVLFRVGSTNADYFVEVNGPCSATMLLDGAGGTHHIRHWALEVASYSGTKVLFDAPNSIILCYGSIYTVTITLAAGAVLTAFSGSEARIRVENYRFDISTQGAGSAFYVGNFYSGRGEKMHFGDVIGNFTAYGVSPPAQLHNYGGTGTSSYITVDRWNDADRSILLSDADLTLAYDSPRKVLVGKALGAIRKVILPPHGASDGQNLFDDRMFEIVKLASAGTSYDLQVCESDEVTVVATIPAATVTQRVKIRFSRGDPAAGGGLGFLTVEP